MRLAWNESLLSWKNLAKLTRALSLCLEKPASVFGGEGRHGAGSLHTGRQRGPPAARLVLASHCMLPGRAPACTQPHHVSRSHRPLPHSLPSAGAASEGEKWQRYLEQLKLLLAFEQRALELCGSTYEQIYFHKYPYGFPSAVGRPVRDVQG